MTPTIAFVGLGAMGAPMARNLMAAGFALRVYNRNPTRAAALAADGAQACGSAAEAARDAAFVVSMVADDEATREVMLGEAGVVSAAGPGAVIIDSSTNRPGRARVVARAAAARGVSYLDAPVTGSIVQAAGRELVFIVGGDPAAFEAARPVFDAMGKMARLIGDSGSGATLKLVNNMLSGAMQALVAEVVTVGEAAGLPADALRDLLSEGAAGSRITRTKIPKMTAREFSPQFQLALMDKDMRYFLAMAQSLDLPVPLASLARSRMQAARRAGLGALDASAVFLLAAGETRGG